MGIRGSEIYACLERQHRFLFLLTIIVNCNNISHINTKYLQKSTFLTNISNHLNYTDYQKSVTYPTKEDTHIK